MSPQSVESWKLSFLKSCMTSVAATMWLKFVELLWLG